MLINQVLKWQDRTLRVISLSHGRAALFPFNASRARPEIYKESELHDLIAAGTIKTIADEYASAQMQHIDDMGNTKSVIKAKQNYELIRPIVEDPECIFNHSYRLKRIREISNDDISLKKKINRLLPQYWTRGQTVKAMLPDYGSSSESSGKAPPRVTVNKTGRKSRQPAPGVVVTEKLSELFARHIESDILKPKDTALSVKGAFVNMLIDFKEHRALYTDDPEAVPTLSQFRYYYYSRYNAKERAVGKTTEQDYKKNVRPLTGSVHDIVLGPGSLYEVDSTTADIFLVDKNGEFVGRPTLYSVIDVYSGMIAAVDASYEPPQYLSIARALLRAFNDKPSLCSKYNVSCTEEEWPVQGIPAKICADNAELLNTQAEHFCQQYGTDFVNTAAYRGDMKGSVEQSIDLLQEFLKQYAKSHPCKISLKKAGAVDLRGKAALNVDDFTALLLTAAIAINHRPRELTPKDYPLDENPTPYNLWHYGREHGLCQLRYVPDPQLLKLTIQQKWIDIIKTKKFSH